MTPWNEIEGWLTESEGNALAALAAGRTVLEIGSWKGRSTAAIARTASRVLCLDTFRGDVMTGRQDTLRAFLANMEAAGCRDKVDLMIGRVQDVGHLLAAGSFGLVFIDDDHGESTDTSTAVAREVVRHDGVVAWHDSGMPVVDAAIRRAFPKHKVRKIDSLAWVTVSEPGT